MKFHADGKTMPPSQTFRDNYDKISWNKKEVVPKSPDNNFMYQTISEYEEVTGLKTNEAFEIGWRMARATIDNPINKDAVHGGLF